MRNFHRHPRVVGYLGDLWRERQDASACLKVVDILSVIRLGRAPVSQRDLLRITGLKTDELEHLIDPMLPVDQQKWAYDPQRSYGLVTLERLGPQRVVHYKFIGRPVVVSVLRQWDGRVFGPSVRESLQWDIAAVLLDQDWIRESDVARRFRYRSLPDGSGQYGIAGVHAHVDDMVRWSRAKRLMGQEVADLLEKPLSHVSKVVLLVRGGAPLDPAGRQNARLWDPELDKPDEAVGTKIVKRLPVGEERVVWAGEGGDDADGDEDASLDDEDDET